ncbi:VOC family protein [Longispora fulva]|uniref:Catechol 2,3-dioxygenase-like lactoylglutathione lyase family enzyme n=1 Tax=Longispora fulva TaxID=619741 RepID=A0A8J7GYV3_9ACTN|nr:VOC family protein [Longispora fulva]MBG6140836.1 catechol 2,3-dioxygenase-like lactoylglutathione lyase family enzyme [Longispora fulva]
MIHHVELWVPSLAEANRSWGWLLGQLGYELFQDWPAGRSWKFGDTYIVFEQSPALTGTTHDRTTPGLNHLALHAGSPESLDRLVEAAPGHGWRKLFDYPYPGNGAAYLVDTQGYEVELVPSVDRDWSSTA